MAKYRMELRGTSKEGEVGCQRVVYTEALKASDAWDKALKWANYHPSSPFVRDSVDVDVITPLAHLPVHIP